MEKLGAWTVERVIAEGMATTRSVDLSRVKPSWKRRAEAFCVVFSPCAHQLVAWDVSEAAACEAVHVAAIVVKCWRCLARLLFQKSGKGLGRACNYVDGVYCPVTRRFGSCRTAWRTIEFRPQ